MKDLCKKWKLLTIILAALLLFSIIVNILASSDQRSRKNKESYSPKYDKELELFQKMNSKEQQEYLNLSRDAKMIKYGGQLV